MSRTRTIDLNNNNCISIDIVKKEPSVAFEVVNVVKEYLSGIFSYKVVDALPAASINTVGHFWLLAINRESGLYDEYITIQEGSTFTWLKLGSTYLPLAGYPTQADIDLIEQGIRNDLAAAESAAAAAAAEALASAKSYADSNISTLRNDVIAAKSIAEQASADLDDMVSDNEAEFTRIEGLINDAVDDLDAAQNDLDVLKEKIGPEGKKVFDYVDEKKGIIEASVASIKNGTDTQTVTWIGNKINNECTRIETGIKQALYGEDYTETKTILQVISETGIETAIAKIKNGTDTEVVQWIGQKIDDAAEQIETAIAERIIEEGGSTITEEWMGQLIDAKVGVIRTGIETALYGEGYTEAKTIAQIITDTGIETAIQHIQQGTDESLVNWVGSKISENNLTIEEAVKQKIIDSDGAAIAQSWVGTYVDGQLELLRSGVYSTLFGEGYTETKSIGQVIDGKKGEIKNEVLQSEELTGTNGVINQKINGAFTTIGMEGIKSTVSEIKESLTEDGEIIDVKQKFSTVENNVDSITQIVGESTLEDGETVMSRFSSIKSTVDNISLTVQNGSNYAAIIAKVNEDGSNVTIKADKIALLGQTVANQLSALKATILDLTLKNALIYGTLVCESDGVVHWKLKNDGTGTLADGNIEWDQNGFVSLGKDKDPLVSVLADMNNRVNVNVGDSWQAPGGGMIKTVDTNSLMAYLQLKEGEVGAIAVGDLCMGIYHCSDESVANETADTDDGKGNRTYSGFYTSYFTITSIGGTNKDRFTYSLRPQDAVWKHSYHPSKGMVFVVFGNSSNTARQTSVYTTRTYTRMLRGQKTWTIGAENIGLQYGDTSNLSVFGIDCSGYSMYLRNIYMTGLVKQVNDSGEEFGGVNPAGVWDQAKVPYQKNSVVTMNDKSFISKVTTSEPPLKYALDDDGNHVYTTTGDVVVTNDVNTEYWMLISDSANRIGGSAEDGEDGVGVSSITNEYAYGTESAATGTWGAAALNPTSANPYVWSREVITYSDGTINRLGGHIVSRYVQDGTPGAAGKGISSVSSAYAVTSDSNEPTAFPYSTLALAVAALNGTSRYMWSKDTTAYTDGTSTSVVRLICVWGDKGNSGIQGCVMRVSEYKADTTTVFRNDSAETGSGVHYIDIVLVANSSAATGYDCYVCKSTHINTGNWASEASYWETSAVNVSSIYTNVVVSKYAFLKYITGEQIALTDESGNVIGGIVGTKNAQYRIWLGAANAEDAPFSVTRAGKLKATNAEISGTITAKSGEFSGRVVSKNNGVVRSCLNGNGDGTMVYYYPNGNKLREDVFVYNNSGDVIAMRTYYFKSDGTIAWSLTEEGYVPGSTLDFYWQNIRAVLVAGTHAEAVAKVATFTNGIASNQFSIISTFQATANASASLKGYNGLTVIGNCDAQTPASMESSAFTGWAILSIGTIVIGGTADEVTLNGCYADHYTNGYLDTEGFISFGGEIYNNSETKIYPV